MRTIFVGDIHGCASEFKKLLREVRFQRGHDRLLLTGDAFLKGPEALEVWKTMTEMGAEMVIGSHDARLLDFLAGNETPSNPEDTMAVEAFSPIREEIALWLDILPYYIREGDFIVVHAGINPEKGLDRTQRDEFLSIRTWPPTDGLEGPRWHDHFDPIDGKVVVFGHDAPGGLVHKRRPEGDTTYLVGLDTGCIYGGSLSAYILEEDEFVQVKSEQSA